MILYFIIYYASIQAVQAVQVVQVVQVQGSKYNTTYINKYYDVSPRDKRIGLD